MVERRYDDESRLARRKRISATGETGEQVQSDESSEDDNRYWVSLSEAARQSGYSASNLSTMVREGILEGKRGTMEIEIEVVKVDLRVVLKRRNTPHQGRRPKPR